MNILAYDLYRAVFLRSDGSNRDSALHSAMKGIWAFHAGCYMEERARELPNHRRTIDLSKGESKAVKSFWYTHVITSDHGGCFTVGYDGENIIVSSKCESDHEGAGKDDCLYIDGIPLRRRETRKVRKDAEIRFIDYIDTSKRSDDWVEGVIQLVPVLH